ncbi:glycosyltransferase [Marinilabiliaceae bacterium JC017]|nr:glycosyltransferase [Marinilabiliaceae bacterium JC017]
MQKKKILIFIDWFLPGYKAGGPVRSMANMVEYLKEEYAFYIYTSNKDHDGEKLKVINNKWIPFNEGAAKVFYSSKPTYGEVKLIIEEVKPEVVYLNSVFSLVYTLFPLIVNRFYKKVSIEKVVFAPRGMFQMGALQLKSVKKRAFLNIVKPILFKVGNIVWHATDEQEMQDVKDEIGEKAVVQKVGNIPTTKVGNYGIVLSEDEIRFVTISLVAEKKNHIFFLKLLRELKVPLGKKVIYDIYGPIKDTEYWERCKEEMENLPEGILVNYKGSVMPSKVSETLQAYHYFVLPTLGENFGHAIFEALINGVPVLLSDQTPWIDLEEMKAGWSIDLNSEEEWKSRFEHLIHEAVDYDCFRKGAKEVAKKYVELQSFKETYRQLYY